MTTIEQITESAPESQDTNLVDYRLEVSIVPVSDVDRAKRFYASLGWREDADFPIREGFRVLQFTPPGSKASVIFGSGITASAPGSAFNLLAVSDVEAARADLVARGADVSEVYHGAPGFDLNGADGRISGPDPERKSYASYAEFRDPDGNEWLLQELTTRLPGREDVATFANLLHETAEHHDPYEKSAPAHNWWDWYAAYATARQGGSTSDEASASAARYMEEVISR